MRALVLLTLTALSTLSVNEAFAVKLGVALTRANLAASGFEVKTAKRDDGRIAVTVVRDLSKAKSFPAESDLRVVRSATLEVRGEKGLIVSCALEPAERNGKAAYRFDIAPEYLAGSRLEIYEIDDYKQELNRERLLGGGTIYSLPLAVVVKVNQPNQ